MRAIDQAWQRADARELEAEAGAAFGELFTDPASGETLAYADLAPAALAWRDQAADKFTRYSERAQVRAAVLARLEGLPADIKAEPWFDALLERMRAARQSATIAVRLADGKRLIRWDVKTGNARLDPDDAREEAKRFNARLGPKLEELAGRGLGITYAVLTMPNAAPGELRRGNAAIFRRFARLMRRIKQGKAPDLAGIVGAAAVLEAPLGRGRDWNVHLNVILVHRGWLDWHAFREAWHWNVQFRQVRAQRDSIGAALRELIKYAVQSVAEKSADKARQGTSAAPPFVEWTDAEIVEWIRAFKRFRRARTYGALFRLPKADKLDLGAFVHVAVARWSRAAGRFRLRFPLLDSIPGDKSVPVHDRVAAFFAFLRGHGPAPPREAVA